MITYREAICIVFEKLREAGQRLIELLNSAWDKIKTIIDEYKPIHDSPIHPAFKRIVFQGLILKHQVINRKPKYICARTTC